MYITNGRVLGGTPNILIFWLLLDNLSISEQTIDRALTIHTELYTSSKESCHLIGSTVSRGF